MTRYFYTDPLAAAWMAKHFGMRFDQGLHGLIGRVMCDDGKLTWEPGIGASIHAATLTIHPDSLHLLEPQVGDVVDSRDRQRDDVGRWVNSRWQPPAGTAVVQRNGIPFHWPEQEP